MGRILRYVDRLAGCSMAAAVDGTLAVFPTPLPTLLLCETPPPRLVGDLMDLLMLVSTEVMITSPLLLKFDGESPASRQRRRPTKSSRAMPGSTLSG